MSTPATIDVVVTDVVEVNALIKRFHFARPDGSPLPAFSGGAHVVVYMEDEGTLRRTPYSLMSSPLHTSDYQISVRRDDEGRGGSLYLHNRVRPGMAMRISYPTNLFALDKRANKHLMFAGGIGITPFIAHVHQASDSRSELELHYSTRSEALCAYGDELRQRLGNRLHTYHDDQDQRIDFEALLSNQPMGTHVYVCGPTPMIEHVLNLAGSIGWSEAHLHYEHFAKAPPGQRFSVELSNSNKTLEVGESQSILEAMEEAGVDAPYLCRGGACGQCETNVLELDGEIQHEDHWLDEQERASGTRIMPCVSRFKGRRLVLER